MQRFEDVEAFLAIVDHGGLTAAARHLRRSLQSVSRSLAALERGVGIELVRRTTRQSTPTEAGLAFHRRVKPALQEIADARLEAASQRTEPSGLLRISAPVLFAPPYLVPAVAAFMARYPRIDVELKLSDRFVDLITENIDLAVRIGDLPDSLLKARRLGKLRRVVFGAPAYFAQHGRPQRPEDLVRHQCVVRTFDGDTDTWPFRVGGKRKTIRVSGRLRADNTAAVYAAVARGLGIGFTPLWQIRDLVDQGVVEPILVAFESPPVPIHAVWPATRLPSAKVRLFVDFLATQLDTKGL
ncbi:LysR family transcriptional regulator [Reyranella sp. CPCC 100927]|uniref:LysR family transcriptional regulator n=1 Tax=Reyranella sp. CPCC 100927 TaxID=2599616 RepID=UPI0011B61568|nr:LysR family transcriptional regulator [Reyranella sp. CPCC 100927]TWT09465.1 LysR family transcriptional regulator [Reyranella sp. CPCC 100927]